jgi:plasmid maintenance system antidote protein VapI
MTPRLQQASERQVAANELEAIISEMQALVAEFAEKLAMVLGKEEGAR